MRKCCVFDIADAEKAFAGADFELVAKYPNDPQKYDNAWGHRELLKCKKCGAYLLSHVFYVRDFWEGCGDSEYLVIYPVDSPAEADEINTAYIGRLANKLERIHLGKDWHEIGDVLIGDESTRYYFYDGKEAWVDD